MSQSALPLAALEALRRGDKLGAIKILREAQGMDLKSAAQLVERHLHGPRGDGTLTSPGEVAASMLRSVLRGEKIDMARVIGESTGMDPVQSKEMADRLRQRIQGAASGNAPNEARMQAKMDAERAKTQVLYKQRHTPTVAPGDSAGFGWLVWVIMLAAAILFVGSWWIGTSAS
jgi:ribosomal protein L7/L12